MRIHTYGEKNAPAIIMLPGSFCNADAMADLIAELETEFRVLAVDYNGQYEGSEKPFTSRAGEAGEIVRYLQEHALSSVALVYGQSMGCEIGMELIAQFRKTTRRSMPLSLTADLSFAFRNSFPGCWGTDSKPSSVACGAGLRRKRCGNRRS